MSSRKKQKLKTFTQTSDEPYIRHHYRVVYANGQQVIVDNYHDVQVHWYSVPDQFRSHVEVLDGLG